MEGWEEDGGGGVQDVLTSLLSDRNIYREIKAYFEKKKYYTTFY